MFRLPLGKTPYIDKHVYLTSLSAKLLFGSAWLGESPEITLWSDPSLIRRIVSFLPLSDLLRLRRLNVITCLQIDQEVMKLMYRSKGFRRFRTMARQRDLTLSMLWFFERVPDGFAVSRENKVDPSEVTDLRLDVFGSSVLPKVEYKANITTAFRHLLSLSSRDIKQGLDPNQCLPKDQLRIFHASRALILNSLQRILSVRVGGHDVDSLVSMTVCLSRKSSSSTTWHSLAGLSGFRPTCPSSVDPLKNKITFDLESEALNDILTSIEPECLPRHLIAEIDQRLTRLPPEFLVHVAQLMSRRLTRSTSRKMRGSTSVEHSAPHPDLLPKIFSLRTSSKGTIPKLSRNTLLGRSSTGREAEDWHCLALFYNWLRCVVDFNKSAMLISEINEVKSFGVKSMTSCEDQREVGQRTSPRSAVRDQRKVGDQFGGDQLSAHDKLESLAEKVNRDDVTALSDLRGNSADGSGKKRSSPNMTPSARHFEMSVVESL